MAKEAHSTLSEAGYEAARRALSRNWPTLTPDAEKYDSLLRALAAFHNDLGASRFELYYNLRPARDLAEQCRIELLHGRLTEGEVRAQLKADAERPVDIQMLRAFFDGMELRCESYGKALQEAVAIANSHEDFCDQIEAEHRVDDYMAGMKSKLPLWKENVETALEFLQEFRIEAGLPMATLGTFEATSAHWLAFLVFDRTTAGWMSCKEVAERSQHDPRYLYSTTASRLFVKTWLPQLPEPQKLCEILSDEFARARLAIAQRGRAGTMDRPAMNILALFANPRGTNALRLGEEDRVLQECVRRSKNRDAVRLVIRHATTIDDARRALLDEPCNIGHFAGHGVDSGLAFEDAAGQLYVPPLQALAELLAEFAPPLQCAVFNACYSKQQAESTSLGIPFAVAMDGPIEDAAAITFAGAFYDSLAAGKDVEFSFRQGVLALKLAGHPGSAVPTLIKGAGGPRPRGRNVKKEL